MRSSKKGKENSELSLEEFRHFEIGWRKQETLREIGHVQNLNSSPSVTNLFFSAAFPIWIDANSTAPFLSPKTLESSMTPLSLLPSLIFLPLPSLHIQSMRKLCWIYLQSYLESATYYSDKYHQIMVQTIIICHLFYF